MQIALLVLFSFLASRAQAHLPIFPDDFSGVYHVENAMTHSYALYKTLSDEHGGLSFGVSFFCEEGSLASVSLSQPVEHSLHFDVTFSHAVGCDSAFDGWNEGSGSYLDDATAPPRAPNETVFEPFGAAMYRKHSGCKFKCKSSDMFTMTVTASEQGANVVVGVGHNEVFDDLPLILSMRVLIYRIYAWSDLNWGMYVALPIAVLIASLWFVRSVFRRERAAYIVASAHLLASAYQSCLFFLFIILSYGKYDPQNTAVSFGIHIILPAVLTLPIYYLIFVADQPSTPLAGDYCLPTKRGWTALYVVFFFFYSLLLVWGDIFFFVPLNCAYALKVFLDETAPAPPVRAKIPKTNQMMRIASSRI